jgi:hypothetical protein
LIYYSIGRTVNVIELRTPAVKRTSLQGRSESLGMEAASPALVG